MIFLIWLVACAAALFLLIKQKYSHFKTRNIKHLNPFPFLGNMRKSTTRQRHMIYDIEDAYKAYPDERFVGFYEFMNPVVILRDPELIKQVAVKDFDYFLDHRIKINEDVDPLFGRNLFSLKGQKWRDMRATLSPAFTGSKMRHMVPFMLDCGKDMSTSLKQDMKSKGVNYLDVEMKDLSTRFSSDVVASCAFGLKINSHSDKENYFYQKGKVAANFTFKQLLIFFAYTSAPYLTSLLKITLFPKEVTDFFRNIVSGTMKNREDNNIIRPDMIHLLMEAKKGKLTQDSKQKDTDAGFATVEESSVGKIMHQRVWTDDDLIAQAVLFFIAGFDTVATLMTFMLYELAVNPDAQEKLLNEIDDNNNSREGDLTYNHIQEMKYMDMVVSETLRKWTPAAIADRICIKPYNLGKPNPKSKEDYIIKEGEGVWIPINAIHHDPEIYPDPDKFDPERFSDENKHMINSSTYLPFGVGPRNCIGSRFALMEVKILAHQLLSQFKVAPSKKTNIPVILDSSTFNLRMYGGHWIRLQTRN